MDLTLREIERRAEEARRATNPSRASDAAREEALSASASDVLYLMGRLDAAERQNRRLRHLVERMGPTDRLEAERAYIEEKPAAAPLPGEG